MSSQSTIRWANGRADPRLTLSSYSRGFSLVELMVASVCLGLAISGVMAMIGSGRQLEMENSNRRQARMISYSKIESDDYHWSRYNLLIPTVPPVTPTTVTLNPGTGMDVTANQYVDVWTGNLDFRNIDGTPLNIPYKEVRVRIQWTAAGRTDSVYVQKRIVEFQ